MKQILDNLYVGNQQDYESKFFDDTFSFLLAAKNPFHKDAVGYTGKSCNKDHPEYLWAYRDRGSKLILNMVDANSSLFFSKEMINEALDFIEEELFKGRNVLICCNAGQSRSASIGLLFLIKQGHIKCETLTDCEAEYLRIYPEYNPGNGIREFVKMNFADYRYVVERVISYEDVEIDIEEILKKVNGSEEKEYEIWSEGYAFNEQSSDAIFFGCFKGHSFLEACINSGETIDITLDSNDNILQISIFGCRLFDNEIDARKSFG